MKILKSILPLLVALFLSSSLYGISLMSRRKADGDTSDSDGAETSNEELLKENEKLLQNNEKQQKRTRYCYRPTKHSL